MTTVESLQGWLALEHRAVWVHPVIGARFDDLADRARDAYEAHRASRDRLLARLSDLDVEPVTTRLAYDVGPLRSATRAIRIARRLERGIGAACLTLAGDSTDELRSLALGGLRSASLAELTWGGRPRAFPGL